LRFFYFFMAALAGSYIVLAILLNLWVYATTKDLDLTLSLEIHEEVREDKRLTQRQILLLDVINKMRYLIVIGVLFSVFVDIFLSFIKK
jgi:hypothetical protein